MSAGNGNGRAAVVLATYASNGATLATCPSCGQAGRASRRPDGQIRFKCYAEAAGCAGSGDYLSAEPVAEQQVLSPATDPLVAAAELGELLGLAALGLEIHGAKFFGRGSGASVDLVLGDGTTVTFDTVRDMANPTRLAVELAACVGAAPKLKAPQAVRAVILTRAIAAHYETLTADEIAVDWGTSYLQSAQVIEVDIEDQAERWGAFCMLRERDERREGHERAPLVVLRHTDGSRLVRTGWYRETVRAQDPGISPQQLAQRMERVGWRRRGHRGRIKATQPGFGGSLAWNFYLVPDGWEDSHDAAAR